jgi:hypothetical protein
MISCGRPGRRYRSFLFLGCRPDLLSFAGAGRRRCPPAGLRPEQQDQIGLQQIYTRLTVAETLPYTSSDVTALNVAAFPRELIWDQSKLIILDEQDGHYPTVAILVRVSGIWHKLAGATDNK